MKRVYTASAWASALTMAGASLAFAAPAVADELPAPAQGVAVQEALVISEVQSKAPETEFGGADWIELHNASDAPLDINGVVVMDAKDEEGITLEGYQPIAAGGYLVLVNEVDFPFGLGKADMVRLFAPGTALTEQGGLVEPASVPFSQTTLPSEHPVPSWGLCPSELGDYWLTASSTPGAANDCIEGEIEVPVEEPSELSTTLAINEVESNGDDTDWIEVANLTDEDIDISGYAIKDNDDSRPDLVPNGSVVPAHGLLVLDELTTTNPYGFDFGLGDGDAARLYNQDGDLVAKYTWDAHAAVSWARCPDGTGPWSDATVSTKGEPNDCSLPVRLNEIESSAPGDGADWVEVINIGSTEVDLAGVTFMDDKDRGDEAFVFPTTVLAPGELAVLEEGTDFDFGLGGDDTARLFDAVGDLLDSFTQPAHAGVTWGRCPDGTGEFANTATATPGELNDCEGYVRALAWPGASAVETVDGEDWFDGDLSGLDYDASTGALWAVHNGDGLLYKMTADAAGTWSLAPGYEDGRRLRYPDGTGTVDSEGVTVRDGEPGVVYVSSERNNDAGSVSRPSVLRYEVAGTGELIATHEWNLSSIEALAALPANGGLEGITWIPADALGTSEGAFAVAVEGTASAYLVQLGSAGEVTLVETLPTDVFGFDLIADVQWDGGQLWVVCDEACDGRVGTLSVIGGAWEAGQLYERPAGMANIANEGFAVARDLCVDGAVPTFYADDADTDGFSLRTGSLSATCPEAPTPVDPETPGGDGGDGGNAGQTDGDDTDSGAPTACTVSAPAEGDQGESLTLRLSDECANLSVTVVMYSEPTVLGTFTVGADGTVTVTIPEDLPAGDHTIEVQSADGTVLGSTAITVNEAGTATPVTTGGGVTVQANSGGTLTLATTGPEAGRLVAGALLLISLGTVMVLAVRRRHGSRGRA
ncbi:lamin tail domain-containing protein [Demequina globuliformis]|uniref:lamin tail domain-containing protein n=1 Tax=Demequina globuliformis TaxID=676202 RepID=UPI000780730A|nr:lamin tail domain-containing protein [Demequina globuliformis]